MIKTFLNHELYKPTPDKQKEEDFNLAVNKALESIKEDVIKYKGEVELRETAAGLFIVVAHCEVYDLQQKMQSLLDVAFHSNK